MDIGCRAAGLAMALLDRVVHKTALLPGASDKWAFLIRQEIEEAVKEATQGLELQVRQLEKDAEGGLRITCDNAYHDRGHGVCSFCVQKRIDEAVKAETERCALLVNEWAKAYPTSVFGFVADGKHGPTVDACSAKALRLTLPIIAEEIRGHELNTDEDKIIRDALTVNPKREGFVEARCNSCGMWASECLDKADTAKGYCCQSCYHPTEKRKCVAGCMDRHFCNAPKLHEGGCHCKLDS